MDCKYSFNNLKIIASFSTINVLEEWNIFSESGKISPRESLNLHKDNDYNSYNPK